MTRFLYRRNRRTTASRVFLASLALVFLLSFTGVVQAAAPEIAEEPVESAVQAPAEAVPSPQEEAPAPQKEEVVEEPAPAAPPAEAPAEPPAAAPVAEAPAAEAPAAEAPAAAPEAEEPEVQSLEESPSKESTPPPDAGGYVTVPGNPATPDGCFKVDYPSAGTHTYKFMHGETTVTVNVVVTEMNYGPVMSWTSDFPICQVIVKGGPNANVYSYGDGAMSGTGLHAPLNENNNKWYGISYITFCPCEEPGEDTWNKHFALTVDGTVTAAVDSYIVKYMLDGVETTTVLSGSNGSSYHADVTVPDDSVISGWVFYAVVDGVEIALTAPGGSETMTGDATNTATFTPGSITGIKYIDADRDSTMPVDPDDSRGETWTITLDGPGLGEGISVMTNAMGEYEFSGLLPGTYSVDEVLKAGFIRVMPLGAAEVVLTLADMSGTQDFLNAPDTPGEDTWNKHFALTVNGTVTADVDSYIVEYMLDGVTTSTVLTGSNGSFHADITVPDGVVISGWVFYAVVDGVEIALTAAGGSETMTEDATNTAEFTPGMIMGVKYLDVDRDETMPVDPDDLLGEGWTITLDGPGLGDGITDMTNVSGVYMFEGLLPGTYSVDEVLKAGFVRIMPLGAVDVTLTLEDMEGFVHFVNQPEVPEWNKHWALTVDGTVTADVDSYIVKYMLDGVATMTALTGSNGSFHADVMVPDDAVISGWVFYAVVNGVEYALTAAGGSETIASDATNTATFTPGTISGIKYIDADRDSTMPVDPDDTLGAGWTITLDGPALGEGVSAVTNASGAYEFTGLLPGTYSVNEVLKAGYVRVHPLGAAEVVLTFADMTGEQHFVNAPPVPAPDTWNKHFALSINGTVAADVDSYIVKYMLNGVATTTVLTGSSGSYHADITVANGAVISGWVFYAVIDGTEVALTTAGGTETITANATNTATFTPGTVTGVKYIDADRDSAAIGDPGDTLGAGWSIHLTGLGLGAGLHATTGANGAYTFTGLLPGVFMVDEVLQSGFVRVSPLAAAPVTLTLAQLAASVNFLNAPVVTPVSDMQIVKEANRTTAGTGDLITYQITYSNTGSTTINAFTIVDEYPEALVTVVDAGGATDDGSKLTWSMTTPLAPGASGFVTYSVRVNSGVAAGTSILNVASIPEFQRSDTATVTVVEEGFLPFTEVIERAVGGAAPFLPFTGVEMLLLLGAASMAAGTGIALRRYMKR